MFPPAREADLVTFLCQVADSSRRPKSILGNTQAAIGHLYDAMDMDNLCKYRSVTLLTTALVKSGSSQPMKPSSVMPTDKFKDLFEQLGNNCDLSIKDLRMKVITLLSLYLMLRPSDIAPHAIKYVQGQCTNIVFATNQLQFDEDGSLVVTFFGIKNDTSRSGFRVILQKHSNPNLDGVTALKCYIERTNTFRSKSLNHGVFINLRAPYGPLTSSSIARVLEDAIKMAGLSGLGFTAKSFRPTGATRAVDGQIDPHVVMSIGRWKTADVFYRHYVHSIPPTNFSDKII